MHLLQPAAPIIVTSRSGCKWPPWPEPESSSPWLENLTATKPNAPHNKKIVVMERVREALQGRDSRFSTKNAEVDGACASHAFAFPRTPMRIKFELPGLQSKRYDEIISQTYWADILRRADTHRERKEN